MRYVYAHFPINVNIEKNSETGLYEVEIRYVAYIVTSEEALKVRINGHGLIKDDLKEFPRGENCPTSHDA